MTEAENVEFLSDMGFEKSICSKALEMNKNNVQEALEWLLVHASNTSSETQASTESSSTINAASPIASLKLTTNPIENSQVNEAEVAGANSLKCEDCGILLKDEDVATLHVSLTLYTSLEIFITNQKISELYIIYFT